MTTPGVTLDTGALVALERRSQRAWARWAAWIRGRQLRTVPAPVLAEWSRGSADCASRILAGVHVEPLSEPLARIAGEALGRVGDGPSVVDAVVMASAARRGDVVYTSDVTDLGRLQTEFPAVRVLGV